MSSYRFGRVLIVGGELSLQHDFATILQGRHSEICVVTTAEQARDRVICWRPDLIVLDLDFELGDGGVGRLVKCALALNCMPIILAIGGKTSALDSFGLRKSGVHVYRQKPVDRASIELALAEALQPPDLRPYLRASVGSRSMYEIEEEVRYTLIREAMGRSRNNKSSAARILRISRQSLQFALRKIDLEVSSDACRR